MKKSQLSPAALGAFVLGALAIAVVSIILFGSGRWFGGERASFVCLFEDAVDGLQIGSKVKLKGVPIGEVKRILLRFRHDVGEGRPATKPHIPVIIEVDVDRLSNDLGVDMEFGQESDYRAQIDDGLRASLGISNLITGILQVNLDYHEDAEPVEELEPFLYEGEVYRVIPTLPSQMAQATSDLLGVVNNISQADVKGLIEGLNEVLGQIKVKLEQFEVKGMNQALESFQARMESPKMDEALDSFSEAAKAVAEAGESVKEVAENLNDQLGERVLGDAMVSADETFTGLREAIASLNGLVTSTEGVPVTLETSLKELGEMATAIRELAAYLAENPNAVIFGRRNKGEGAEDDEDRKPWRGGPRG